MDADARLAAHWRDLADALALSGAVTERGLDELLARYGEPARHYHTATHIVALLDQMAGLPFEDRDTARLAVVFHDVIYDPARSDNEALSAALMRERLTGHVAEDRLDRAAVMIEATKSHKATGDQDTNLVLDLDMGILGQPWPVYEAYAHGVMAEYMPVYGADAYRLGRMKMFIEPTLTHEALFLTPQFHHLDATARDNLRREKAWLEGGAP